MIIAIEAEHGEHGLPSTMLTALLRYALSRPRGAGEQAELRPATRHESNRWRQTRDGSAATLTIINATRPAWIIAKGVAKAIGPSYAVTVSGNDIIMRQRQAKPAYQHAEVTP